MTRRQNVALALACAGVVAAAAWAAPPSHATTVIRTCTAEVDVHPDGTWTGGRIYTTTTASTTDAESVAVNTIAYRWRHGSTTRVIRWPGSPNGYGLQLSAWLPVVGRMPCILTPVRT